MTDDWTEVRFEWITSQLHPGQPTPANVTLWMPFIPRVGELVVLGDDTFTVKTVFYDLTNKYVVVRFR